MSLIPHAHCITEPCHYLMDGIFVLLLLTWVKLWNCPNSGIVETTLCNFQGYSMKMPLPLVWISWDICSGNSAIVQWRSPRNWEAHLEKKQGPLLPDPRPAELPMTDSINLPATCVIRTDSGLSSLSLRDCPVSVDAMWSRCKSSLSSSVGLEYLWAKEMIVVSSSFSLGKFVIQQ